MCTMYYYQNFICIHMQDIFYQICRTYGLYPPQTRKKVQKDSFHIYVHIIFKIITMRPSPPPSSGLGCPAGRIGTWTLRPLLSPVRESRGCKDCGIVCAFCNYIYIYRRTNVFSCFPVQDTENTNAQGTHRKCCTRLGMYTYFAILLL